MATPMLTAARLREILSYDPETGIFVHRTVKRGGKKAGAVAGCLNKRIGYWVVRIDRKLYYAHRLAWLHAHGEWPAEYVDHINGVRDDNRLVNLRCVDHTTNCQNKRAAQSNSASGLLGVVFVARLKKFKAEITIDRRMVCLGWFATAEEAYKAYLQKKRQVHAGCTI